MFMTMVNILISEIKIKNVPRTYKLNNFEYNYEQTTCNPNKQFTVSLSTFSY